LKFDNKMHEEKLGDNKLLWLKLKKI